jgi:translation initiation factor 2 subunit 1
VNEILAPIPDLDEYVIATVRKIMPYGAFCSLDEYGGIETFLHVSEVSSGWIRNIREHVKEGQRIVAKVMRIDSQKNQIDISLKRVTEADRKRKLLSFTNEQRATKLLEHCAKKMKVPPQQAIDEAGNALVAEFGDLYSAFEAISNSQPVTSKIKLEWLAVVTEVAKQEIKQKFAAQRYVLKLESYDGKGVEIVRNVLSKVASSGTSESVKVAVHYVGAPNYFVDATAKDYKTLDKWFSKVTAAVTASIKADLTDFSFDKLKA